MIFSATRSTSSDAVAADERWTKYSPGTGGNTVGKTLLSSSEKISFQTPCSHDSFNSESPTAFKRALNKVLLQSNLEMGTSTRWCWAPVETCADSSMFPSKSRSNCSASEPFPKRSPMGVPGHSQFWRWRSHELRWWVYLQGQGNLLEQWSQHLYGCTYRSWCSQSYCCSFKALWYALVRKTSVHSKSDEDETSWHEKGEAEAEQEERIWWSSMERLAQQWWWILSFIAHNMETKVSVYF